MPDVSIAVSARNNFSREFERMSRDAGAFNKDVEELNREITALNKKKATLKTDLDGAKKELRDRNCARPRRGWTARRSPSSVWRTPT